MKFAFFTFGGKQFWQDLFFYQGWRIQRNLVGRFRLLDPWDIRRESGTLRKCQNAFVRYVDVYQILRQKDRAVILLHGWGRSKDMFDKMAKRIESEGLLPIGVNYPSLFKSSDVISSHLDMLLEDLRDVKELSFVAKGLGGLLLRKLLAKNGDWQKRIKISKIVLIDSPRNDWGLISKIRKWRFGSKLLGPSMRLYEKESISKLPDLPQNIDIGVLTTWNPLLKWIMRIVPESWQKLFPSAKEAHIPYAKDISSSKYYMFNSCADKRVINACISFLKTGKFKVMKKIKKL